MNKPAFTLIEIVVTVAIILLIVVFAVPAFSKYASQKAFSNKVSEIESIINQAYISSQNPEQNKYGYEIKPASGIVGLNVWDNAVGSSATAVKAVTLILPNQTYSLLDGHTYMACNEQGKNCLYNNGAISSSYSDFFRFSDTEAEKTATFQIKNNPFMINITYGTTP